MARTTNGNLIGKAARKSWDDVHDYDYADQLRKASDELTALIGLNAVIEIQRTAQPGKVLDAMTAAIEKAKEQARLAHIDALVGDERLTIAQMNDAVDLPFEIGAEVYDFTPCEIMPIINFDEIEEIEY